MLAVAISPHCRLWGVGVRSDVLTIWWIKDDWWCGPVLRTGHLNVQANVGNMKLLVTQALLISYNLISIMLRRLRTNGRLPFKMLRLCKRQSVNSRNQQKETTWTKFRYQKFVITAVHFLWNHIIFFKVLETMYPPPHGHHTSCSSAVFCQILCSTTLL